MFPPVFFHGTRKIGHFQRLVERDGWIFAFDGSSIETAMRRRFFELLPNHREDEFMNDLRPVLEVQR